MLREIIIHAVAYIAAHYIELLFAAAIATAATVIPTNHSANTDLIRKCPASASSLIQEVKQP